MLVQRTAIIAVLFTILSALTVSVADASPACDPGEFCAWAKENYAGKALRLDLQTANPGDCIPLDGLTARSFINLMRNEVTVYQGESCSTEADFTTYPGRGSFVPVAPFVVRAIQVWE
jgi:hypothetical protein